MEETVRARRESRPRAAKEVAVIRFEQAHLDDIRVREEINGNFFTSEDERERVQRLQMVHLRCTATTKRGVVCKRSGCNVVAGRNLCEQHKRMVENGGTCPTPKRKRTSDKDVPAHAVRTEHVIFVEDDPQCSICFQDMHDNEITVTNCGHMYHEHCLRRWKRDHDTCPKCRRVTMAFRNASDRLILARRIIPRSFC